MKLYVWDDVLTDWTDGIMFAFADSVDEARRLILEECEYVPREDLNKEPEVYDNQHAARVIWGVG